MEITYEMLKQIIDLWGTTSIALVMLILFVKQGVSHSKERASWQAQQQKQIDRYVQVVEEHNKVVLWNTMALNNMKQFLELKIK